MRLASAAARRHPPRRLLRPADHRSSAPPPSFSASRPARIERGSWRWRGAVVAPLDSAGGVRRSSHPRRVAGTGSEAPVLASPQLVPDLPARRPSFATAAAMGKVPVFLCDVRLWALWQNDFVPIYICWMWLLPGVLCHSIHR